MPARRATVPALEAGGDPKTSDSPGRPGRSIVGLDDSGDRAGGLAGGMLVPSLTGFFVVAGISFVGVMEYIGSGRMWRGERSAPGFLARNQLLFVLVIIAYCVYQMATFSPDAMYSSPETREMLAQAAGDLQQAIEAALPLFYYAVYGLVMLLSAVCQGGLALYYVTRRRYVDLFNRETPAWIVRIMAEVEQ